MADADSIGARLRALALELPRGTKLLAVSKGHPAALIREAVAAGQRSFGESRLQEAVAKQKELVDLPALDWHFIGRLQANKVRAVLRAFGTIHSVDSLELAQRVDRIAGEEKLCPQVFYQVKLRPDPTKGGFDPLDLSRSWPELRELASLRSVGLMTMAPLAFSAEQRRLIFEECAALAETLGLAELSMGMSDDWREAAAAGSTWVRIGGALFRSQH